MNSKPFKAVILAGGKGTRLRPLTVSFPKPLVPLGDKPILEILLLRLKAFGVTNMTISTGYLSQMIVSLCGDGSGYGVNLDYVHEEEPLGTAGALSLIENLPENFMVMNGDLLTTLNLNNMMTFHEEKDADVTIGIYRREIKIDFGVVETHNGEFLGFKEKPILHHDVSMGVNILSKRVMKYVEKNQHLDMPDLILRVHEAGGKVCCYQEDCYWLDIGRMDDYAQAQIDYEANREQFLGIGIK
ncbi:MAG: NDP-sugar pyrophosphorylase family protein [Candidatus Azotimanducaceae bacterium]|jgi:NDP-sugar pyrophosphorylase family protein